MQGTEKIILRFVDGKMMKGFVSDLKLAEDHLFIEDETRQQLKVRLKELKAIFFVKRFEGNPSYQEKKIFAGTHPTMKRVLVMFKDGENITGFIDGAIPWKKGFFLETMQEKGFYLLPVDQDSNNQKILVVATAVRDVAMIDP
ncbi:MAG: hypothetical protein M0042_06395 [Nitrospiraceae bacterium]|nr:hypothetical protein [Nitrospiraceae bacterium]